MNWFEWKLTGVLLTSLVLTRTHTEPLFSVLFSDHGDVPDATDLDHDSSSSDCSGSSDRIGVQCVVSGKMGCGEWSNGSHYVCTFCDNRLLSVDTDAFGRRLHLGQRIFFYRLFQPQFSFSFSLSFSVPFSYSMIILMRSFYAYLYSFHLHLYIIA